MSHYPKQRTCLRCGASFTYRKSKYCSPACGLAAQREHLAANIPPPEMWARRQESPLTRRGPQHHTGRDWHLRAPDGRQYSFRNLSHFVRSHPDLFAPEDILETGRGGSNATAGLRALRPTPRCRALSWKGWTWAE